MTVAFIRPNKKDGRLAKTREARYSRKTKSRSLRVVESSFSLLSQLRDGKSVVLAMTVPRFGESTIKRTTTDKPIPVVLVPGVAFGAPNAILVAVIGKGSAVIVPWAKNSTARLVLAGIPVRLAVALMDEIHRVFPRR